MLRALLQSAPHDAGPASLALVETMLRPGWMTPLHVHARDEAVQVVEGAIAVHRGGLATELRAGEALLLAGGEPHTLRAGSPGARIRTASFVVSAARYEDFVRAVAAPGGWLSDQDAATLDALARPNGIDVIGPPGALSSGAAA